MPFGYLFTVVLIATCTLVALAPQRPRRTTRSSVRFWLSFLVNEVPFLAFYLLVASTLLALAQGDLDTPVGWVALAIAVLATVGLGVVAWRGVHAHPVLQRALHDGLGAGWRDSLDPEIASRLHRRLPLARILVAPFFFRRRDVEQVANIRYGDAGRANLLDLYRHRSHPLKAPVLIHLHGGAFRSGRKSRESRALFYRLASRGWICVSANYRLRPATFPDHLIDVKKVIAWVREHGQGFGADPNVVLVAGSSAGGHLAACAALTANDAGFQPGFEQADTSILASVSLYGYYGRIETQGPPSSPRDYIAADAPPFLVVHGDKDTLVRVEDARDFVGQLRSTSTRPVVYAELPGAQHTLDMFHSLRFEAVVDAIEEFAAWVRSSARA